MVRISAEQSSRTYAAPPPRTLNADCALKNILSLPNGTYHIHNNTNALKTFDLRTVERLLQGDIFCLMRGDFTITKTSSVITIGSGQSQNSVSQIAPEVLSLFSSWIPSRMMSVSINMNMAPQIKIRYSKKGTISYIHKIEGVDLAVDSCFSPKKLDMLLDCSRYRIIMYDHAGSTLNFFGLIKNHSSPDNVAFDYFVYTSESDIQKRGVTDVFKRSNEAIRTLLRPLVHEFRP